MCELDRSAGGAEDLELVTGLERFVVRYWSLVTRLAHLVDPGQRDRVKNELEDLRETQSVLPSDIKAGNCLAVKRSLS